MGQSCGSCKWWSSPDVDGFRMCNWLEENAVPFWVNTDASDHSDWTRSRDGKLCVTWEARDGKS
jgi:hypothetical protein